MRILFTGGGTGGHVFPIISVARELKKIYNSEKTLEMFFLGTGAFVQQFEKEEIKTKIIITGKLRRYFSVQNILDFFKMPLGLIQSFLYLYAIMPDVIFSKGGYDSIPVILAAWVYRIPVMIHESDSIPGLANRLAAKFSKRIAVSFSSAESYFSLQKTVLVGNPIRLEVIQKCLSLDQNEKEKAKNDFKIISSKPIIFILGGSQGAKALNEVVLDALPQLLEKYEIIHQCGPNNYQEIKEIFTQSPLPDDYHLYPFLEEDQMAAAYLLSSLVISRAGAGSISEISACGKPSILIPLLDAAADHQRKNAFNYLRIKATVVIEQQNLTSHLFLNEIQKILDNPEMVQQMSANAKTFSHPEAALKIAQSLIEMGE